MPHHPDHPPLPEETERLESQVKLQLPRPTLIVQVGDPAGKRLPIGSAPVTLGSSPTADLQVAGRGVSRRHAEVVGVESGYLLRDLDSKNGTFLNGRQIREAFLCPGDLIGLGSCQIRFEPQMEDIQIPPCPHERFGPLYGKSLVMRQLFGKLERIAATDVTLLILGESGTGKDLVARAVHEASRRARKPLVVFDCSSVSPELLASELFGHVEGAFTGASRSRRGAFEAAAGGTLFLDEIGEMPLDLQPKLLRMLESRTIRPVGSNAPVPVDVRVIAATHRNLKDMVSEERFRLDLYYRLAVVSVVVPPLRERREDIGGLTQFLTEGMAGPSVEFSPGAITSLAARPWPGNVRELRNVLERTLTFAQGPVIAHGQLLFDDPPAPGGSQSDPTVANSLDDAERITIQKALEQTGWRQREAAKILGIHRHTLRAKMRRYNLATRGSQDGND